MRIKTRRCQPEFKEYYAWFPIKIRDQLIWGETVQRRWNRSPYGQRWDKWVYREL